MFTLKYGLKSILRTPLKTVLFFLLIAVVTAFLSLGIGMWNATENMLDEADAVFMTAGEFVYKLGNYPDSIIYDEGLSQAYAAFDLEDYARDGVLLLEENITQRAYLEGYIPNLADKPYADYALLSVYVLYYADDFDAWVATVSKAHQSERDMEGKTIHIAAGENSAGMEKGQNYIVFGSYYVKSGSAYSGFHILSFYEDFYANEDGAAYPPVVNLADWDDEADFWQSEFGAYCQKIAETLRIVNNSVDLTASGNVEAVEAFHLGQYTLIDGGFFEAEDYKAGNVCIIPQRISRQMNLSVGDSITLSIHKPTEQASRYISYWVDEGFAATEAFTIVGIYQADDANTPIFIPNAGQDFLAHSENDYVLARAVLSNRTAESYIEAVSGLLPGGVQFNPYDQGYQASIIPIRNMRETALLITIACLIACLLILWFFGYFLIHRNAQSARMLLVLGAGAARTRSFLLTGSGLIALLAASFGSLGGYFFSRNAVSSIYQSITENSVYDLRFSINGYGIQSESFSPSPAVDWTIYLLLAAAVFAAALLFSAIFAHRVIQAQNPRYRYRKQYRQAQKQRRDSAPKNAVGAQFTAKIPGVSLRYALKSILRGGKRSLTVPILFAALLLFLCVFSGIRAGYDAQLGTVYQDIPVTLRFSDITGRKIDNLVIRSDLLEELDALTDYVSETWSSQNRRFMYMGVVSYADGTVNESGPEVFVEPTNEYVRETFVDQLNMLTAPLVITDDLGHTPEFYYAGEPEITWAEGLGWEDYRNFDYQGYAYCLVPTSFLEEYGLSLGDTISMIVFRSPTVQNLDYKECYYTIGGTFASDNPENTVYFSPNTLRPIYPEVMADSLRDGSIILRIDSWYASYIAYMEQNAASFFGGAAVSIYVNPVTINYHAAGAVLQNAERLSEFKDWLEEHYDKLNTAGRNRKWAIVDDAALYSTIDSLTRYINYMNLLYPVILALVAVIGFIVSSLLLRSRTAEIAVQRSMGTRKLTVFLSFFLEPLLLSVPGILIGLLLSFLLLGGWDEAFLRNLLLFAPCYFAGAALAIFFAYRKAVMQSLAQKEE